jgi:addiction module RelE/StbE family toxin
MGHWQVQMTDESETQLVKDFKSGVLSKDDIQVLKAWISEVETKGLIYAQNNKTWRDHELDGKWKGHRAISFSFSGRVIYRIEEQKVIVRVVRVTANHEY